MKRGGVMHTITDKKLLMLKPGEIVPSNYQSRKNFDEYELKLLADSISASGIIQPISVRKREDGRYELIAGERRLKAAVIAGLRRVPCVVHKTDNITAALYSITENLQRSNLTFFEEAQGIETLINSNGISQAEAAVRLGIAQSTLSNKLRLLKLDENLRQRIVASSLTERHARALLRLPYYTREEALDFIIAQGLTLKQTEDYIAEKLKPQVSEEKKNEKPVRKAAIGDVRLFSNSLTKLVDTLQSAGISAHTRKYETEKYIEYKVRIKKELPQSFSATQLKIC